MNFICNMDMQRVEKEGIERRKKTKNKTWCLEKEAQRKQRKKTNNKRRNIPWLSRNKTNDWYLADINDQ